MLQNKNIQWQTKSRRKHFLFLFVCQIFFLKGSDKKKNSFYAFHVPSSPAFGGGPNLFTDPHFFLSQTSYNLHVGPNSKEPNIPSVHGLCTAFVQPECSIFFLSR